MTRRGGRSALITKKLAGWDCLNMGCFPSKALLSTATALQVATSASNFQGKCPTRLF